MNEFFEDLSNFKKAYDETMGDVSICPHVPKILALPKCYMFATSLTTTVILLSFILFVLYKFTPIKSSLHSRLKRKKIIELEEET
ncbi:PIR Superfamily Protein [Plasmodium malariae]|uniref:PIR Superfamily Protein n=1 Tax=Plasmodium malariae TaxID=5858 RepID=A0A1A8X8A0_PLAMA|nr:PIR Superfamily Protein [Plasmodium malariae]